MIATGSLFEFEINHTKSSQGPTGRVEYAYLEPMTFEEFLRAYNEPAYEKLCSLDISKAIPESLHGMFTKHFREYMVCGGMPAAVKAKIKGQGPLRIDEIKSDIITGYLGDLPKYAMLNKQKYDNHLLELLLKKIMGSTANTMKYSELAPGYRAEVVRKHLDVMLEARVIRRSLHTNQSKMPLSIGEKEKCYKLFSLDVGLCYSFMEMPLMEVYAAKDINDVVNGALSEQFVAQTIAGLPPYHRLKRLHHWQRQKPGATSEVDFLFSAEGMVIPIECKSGYSSKMKSLRIMMSEKKFPLALRLYAGNIQKESLKIAIPEGKQYDATLLSLPHYMLERFVNNVSSIH